MLIHLNMNSSSLFFVCHYLRLTDVAATESNINNFDDNMGERWKKKLWKYILNKWNISLTVAPRCLYVWKIHSSVNNFSATLTSQKTLIAMKRDGEERRAGKMFSVWYGMCNVLFASCQVLMSCFNTQTTGEYDNPRKYR